MISLLKNSNPYTALLLLIYAFLGRLPELIHPVGLAPATDADVLYGWVRNMLDIVTLGQPFLVTLLSIISIYGQSLYLNFKAQQAKLTARSGYMVSFMYLSLTALQPEFTYLHKTHLLVWLFLLAIHFVLKLPNTLAPRKLIFNAAYVLAVMAILQCSALAGILFLVVSLLLLRTFRIKEWMVGIMGYATPFYFFIAVLYIFNQLALIKLWPSFAFQLPKQLEHPVYFIVIMSSVILITASGMFTLASQSNKMTIEIKRKWLVIHLAVFIAIIISIFANTSISQAWMLPLAPLSIIASFALQHEHYRRINNFTFYFIIAVLIYAHYFSSLTSHI